MFVDGGDLLAWSTPVCVDCNLESARYSNIMLLVGRKRDNVQSVTTILDECRRLSNWFVELICTVFDILF